MTTLEVFLLGDNGFFNIFDNKHGEENVNAPKQEEKNKPKQEEKKEEKNQGKSGGQVFD